MINEFQFAPGQYVRITLFGLNYPGRVTECVLRSNSRRLYEVEYAVEGELKARHFAADELEAGNG